tara:strand:- start:361 stop:1863 length:1503 start_codon:yes stop_codon:yes gene_type:complete
MALTKIPSELSSTTGIVDNSNATAITIDSSENVGIGTSSPASTLEIAKNDQTNGATLSITNSSNSSGWDAGDIIGSIDFRTDDTSTTQPIRGQIKLFEDSASGTTYANSNAMSFSTGSNDTLNERMRIDSSGKVGIGTTNPVAQCAIGSAGRRIEIQGDAGTIRGFDRTATWAALDFEAASYTFDIAGSERMRIDSSGKVGIGTSTTVRKLTVNETGTSAIAHFESDQSASKVYFHDANTSQTYSVALGSVGDDMAFYASSGGSERMRIDSSGNVNIGNGSVATGGDNYVYSYSGGSSGQVRSGIKLEGSTNTLEFYTGQTERMRIDSSGTLLLLHSSESNNVALSVGGGSSAARVIPAVDNQGYIGQSNRRWQAIYAVDGSIETSDEREKTEIKPTTLGLDFIKDLKPVSYKWIDAEQQNKGKDKREHQGLIAQQVAETVEKYGIDKNSFGGLDIQKTDKYNDFHGMTYSQLIAPLIKAIQEQQTLIESLTDRIAALEE